MVFKRSDPFYIIFNVCLSLCTVKQVDKNTHPLSSSAPCTTLFLYHLYLCHHLSLYCSSDCSWGIQMQESGLFCLDQNSSSAFRQRDCLSRVRRASTSATDSSPWTLLSLVRTLTQLVIFSFSPTTAKTWEDTTAWHGPSHTIHTHAATLTHSPLCDAAFNNSGWLTSLEVHLL